MKHIPNRNFGKGIDQYERARIVEQYADPKWDRAKGELHNLKITLSAIKVSETIKKHLGIELFPCIRTVARKGYPISDGTFAFAMINEYGRDIYFGSRVQMYKSDRWTYERSAISTTTVIYPKPLN